MGVIDGEWNVREKILGHVVLCLLGPVGKGRIDSLEI